MFASLAARVAFYAAIGAVLVAAVVVGAGMTVFGAAGLPLEAASIVAADPGVLFGRAIYLLAGLLVLVAFLPLALAVVLRHRIARFHT